MNEEKKQDISPTKNEETLTAEDLSEEEDEKELIPGKPSEYLDQIMADVQKLSAIIDAIAAINMDQSFYDISYSNLAWAMHEFTNSIYDSAEDLWDHLKDIDALQSPRPDKPIITEETGKAQET